ncbi:Radical SAM superfamily enzyme YgiQ, UPF0313 family [Lachnospiraceae bacterium XBB1006]|nr:Radical SAM superfamily enzyme YgiQ, UPF0313 family [Lachnospiraceae bacterium XBB1006]
MKIVLVAINTKYIHSNLAVYALSSYVRAKGETATVCEYTINHDADDILQDLYQKRPDVVAFSCYLWNYVYINELTRELKRLLPTLDIWLGGPEVSYEARNHLMQHPEIRGILLGEGEETFLQLCQFYHGKGKLADIAGMIYREEDAILETPTRPCLDLDTLPFPYENLEAMEHKILYYESSRGCPFSCSYCLSSVDRHLRFKSLPKVYGELQQFIDANVPQVKFVDRTYNAKVEHALAIWEFIKEHDNGITNFHFEVAADILRPEEIQCLQGLRPGLVQLEIGVQSTNEQTIREIHRVMDLEKVRQITKTLKAAGNINLHLDLIAGLPFETYRRFQQSFDDLYKMRPHQLQLGFLKVLKGSYMYEHALEYGILYHERPPYEVMQTKWITYDEIILLKQVEQMVECYYNSGQFSTMLGVYFCREKRREGVERPFQFFRRLADYYLEKGQMSVSQSRLKRYELLLDFLESIGEERELYEEAAMYDLYLRENLKSRPSFAKETDVLLREWKKKYGKTRHLERFSYDFSEGEFYEYADMPKQEPVRIEFFYNERNPVTGNVRTKRIDDDEAGTNDGNPSSHG